MLTYLLMLVLQPVLALAVWWMTRGRPRLVLGVMLGAGALILFKSLVSTHPAWEAAVFPFADYVFYQGFVLYAGAAIFFGAVLAHLATWREQAVFALLFLAAVAYSGHANYWLADRRIYGEEIFADANLHCQQTTSYTCGPAACVAALAHCGVRVSERQMAALCGTNLTGTGIFNVFRGVTLALAGSTRRAAIRELPAEALLAPGVVAVLCLPGHAIAVAGEGGDVIVDDPLAFGPEHKSLEQLRKIYTGTAVMLEPRPAEPAQKHG